MDFYIQFGSGMIKMSEDLIDNWQTGTIILSPRDLKKEQIDKLSRSLNDKGGEVIVDPQFYIPRSKHDRLNSHEFWPEDYQTFAFNGDSVKLMLSQFYTEYCLALNSPIFIIPGVYSSSIDDDWKKMNEIFLDQIESLEINKPKFLTLCLSHEVICSEESIHLLLEYLEDWPIDGLYLVPEPPNNNYLVDHPIWLLNLLDLTSGIKLLGKKVIVGYSSHQMLILANAKVDAIASGNWLNVRSFNTNKFQVAEKGAARRSKWYYCPKALSEYQIPMLDMALRLGILDRLKPGQNFQSVYSDSLFSGAQPSVTAYGESDSFKHYLTCLRAQVKSSSKATYEATKQASRMRLETAGMLTEVFKENGVIGKKRDFSDVIDSTVSALTAFDKIKGLMMNHKWNDL